MNLDIRSFRRALGRFATGVIIVTAGQKGAVKGITVNSFSSLSLDPPLILWCLSHGSSRYHAFTNEPEFTVSILDKSQQAVADHLASGSEYVPGDVALEPTLIGPPSIAGALTVLECRRTSLIDGGDHTIIIGEVLSFRCREDGDPLLYYGGAYRSLAAKD